MTKLNLPSSQKQKSSSGNVHRFVEEITPIRSCTGRTPRDSSTVILHDLTQMEEMLCTLASPFFLMWVSKGGQFKTRGNVIFFFARYLRSVLTVHNPPSITRRTRHFACQKTERVRPIVVKRFPCPATQSFQVSRFYKTKQPIAFYYNIRDVNDVDLSYLKTALFSIDWAQIYAHTRFAGLNGPRILAPPSISRMSVGLHTKHEVIDSPARQTHIFSSQPLPSARIGVLGSVNHNPSTSSLHLRRCASDSPS